jgi:hypothetical protein
MDDRNILCFLHPLRSVKYPRFSPSIPVKFFAKPPIPCPREHWLVKLSLIVFCCLLTILLKLYSQVCPLQSQTKCDLHLPIKYSFLTQPVKSNYKIYGAQGVYIDWGWCSWYDHYLIGKQTSMEYRTKLTRNTTTVPMKRTAVERQVNMHIVFLFVLLMSLLLVVRLGLVIVSLSLSGRSEFPISLSAIIR